MRAIFYSPMASANAASASGVERMGALLQQALGQAGVEVTSPVLPRSYEGKGDAALQEKHRNACEAAARGLIVAIAEGALARPDFWFSYHVYYKSPDWIGPMVAAALGIPYLIAEASHAPKRAGGPFDLGHRGAENAIAQAARLFAMTSFDRVCLDRIAEGRVRDLKPFIALPPSRAHVRKGGEPRLVCAAMMRNERKLASYVLLARAVCLLSGERLTLSIAGDGDFRAEIEREFGGDPRVTFLGAHSREQVDAMFADADFFVWPGLGEAYGLVYLEAQAAGLAVAACRDRGVPDAVSENVSALLSTPGDAEALARNISRLAGDAELRRRMGEAGRRFVEGARSVHAAGAVLRGALEELGLR